MSQKTIALQLRTLAADPDSQALLLREASCLTGLVALLNADNEEDVLILSLQALQFLAGPSAHHATLVNAPGLVLALTLLTDKPAITVKSLASNVLASLEGYINGSSGSATPASARRTPLHSRPTSRGNTRPTTPSCGPREHGSGLMGSVAPAPRYLNHVLFHITTSSGSPLDKLAQADVEKGLVALKGVISVTYSAAHGKDKVPCFTLYTSHRPAALQPLVTKAVGDLRAGYVVHLVAKDGTKSTGADASGDKENQENEVPKQSSGSGPSYLKAGPSYLNKSSASNTTGAKATSSSSTGGPGYLNSNVLAPTGSRALTNHSTATSASDSAQGLAARYSAAKKKAAPTPAVEAPKKGILSSVTSFFW